MDIQRTGFHNLTLPTDVVVNISSCLYANEVSIFLSCSKSLYECFREAGGEYLKTSYSWIFRQFPEMMKNRKISRLFALHATGNIPLRMVSPRRGFGFGSSRVVGLVEGANGGIILRNYNQRIQVLNPSCTAVERTIRSQGDSINSRGSFVSLADGQVVFSAGTDISILNPVDGKIRQFWEGQIAPTCFTVLPSGKIVVASWLNVANLSVLDSSLVEPPALRFFQGVGTGFIFELLTISEGVVASGGSNGQPLCIWDIEGDSARLRRHLHGHEGDIVRLAKFSDGRLVSAGVDGTLRVWASDFMGATVLSGHQGSVSEIAILDPNLVISGGRDGTVRLWNMEKGVGHVLYSHDGAVTFLAVLCAVKQEIVSGGMDGVIYISNAKNRHVIASQGLGVVTGLMAVSGRAVHLLLPLSDGRIVVGDEDGNVHSLQVDIEKIRIMLASTALIQYPKNYVDRVIKRRSACAPIVWVTILGCVAVAAQFFKIGAEQHAGVKYPGILFASLLATDLFFRIFGRRLEGVL